MSGRAIFLAVGTQLPFDRLTKALDGWCGATGRGAEVFGQVGHLDETHVTPAHFEWQARIGPEDYTQRMQNADVIVSHAGMGTIITALTLGKPIIIMARRAHLGEQRNDHQYATLKRFKDRAGVFAVETEEELAAVLEQLLQEGQDGQKGQGGSQTQASAFAEERLTNALKDFIHNR
jgi:UDP-N-acetylglucosamine transferase subunit ALG13